MKTANKVLISSIAAVAGAAIAGLTLWLSSAPDVPRYRYLLGTTQGAPRNIAALELRNEKNESALDLAELAGYYFQQGHVSGDASWFNKAEAAAKRSLTLLPAPNPAKLTLAQVADARHDFPEAIRLAKEVLKDRPQAAALTVIVTSNLAMGNFAEAGRVAEQLIAVKPGSDTYLTRGLVYSAQGRDEEAIFDFRRSAQLEDIGNPEGAARLRALWGRLLTRRGEYRTAAALFDESLRILPNNHLALALEGEMEMRRGNYAGAQKRLMDAFTASKQLRYLIRYAQAKKLEGDAATAREVLTQCEKLARADLTDGRYGHPLELVEVLLEKGTPAAVQEAIGLAKTEVGFRRGSETYYWLAKSLAAGAQWNEAIEAIQGALATGVKEADYYYLAGKIENARGYWPRAGFYLDAALAIDPGLKAASEEKASIGKPAAARLSSR